MGPQPSKIEEGNSLSSQGSSQKIEDTSNVLVSHERFQKVQFFMKTKQMKVELAVDNKTILVEWESSSKAINIQQINEYALLPKSWEYQKISYCGNTGVVKIIYDCYPFLLQKQIQTRLNINKLFTEEQLFELIYILLVCAEKFHTNWKKIGDVRPKNIFKNQKGQIKIGNTYSWPMQLNNYEKTVFEKEITYLAPQQMHDIKMGRIDQDLSRNAKQHIIEAESFSIGLTLLHVGLLSDMSSLYNTLTNEFDRDLLTKKILEWQKLQNYTNTIKQIIKGLCQEIPERRLLTTELLPLLLPVNKIDRKQLNKQVLSILQKKSAESLVGTIWKACEGGLLQSFIIQRSRGKILQPSILDISQIKPSKTEQKMNESPETKPRNISLGGSNLSKVSSQKSSQKNNYKISNYEIGNRFVNPTVPNEKLSLQKSKYEYPHNYKMQDSSYFTTPLGQSVYTFPNAGQSQFQASRLQSRFKPAQSNHDLLRHIQDQLQKSRKNFPN